MQRVLNLRVIEEVITSDIVNARWSAWIGLVLLVLETLRLGWVPELSSQEGLVLTVSLPAVSVDIVNVDVLKHQEILFQIFFAVLFLNMLSVAFLFHQFLLSR